MKNLAKQIVNYDCSTATTESRGRLLMSLINESLKQLGLNREIDPNSLEIKFNESKLKGGSYYNNVVNLPSDFLLEKQRFVFDIMVIAHEMCHCYQEHTFDNNPLNPIHAKSTFNISPFNNLLYHIVRHKIA